jgi:tetratricopeptide (TPR) repeat protein
LGAARSRSGPSLLDRWVVARARRSVRAARYWYSVGDLDEAARAGRRALALARSRASTTGLMLPAQIALTLARVEQDRDDYVAGHGLLTYALGVLEPASGSTAGDRLRVWALIGLGESHRRAARYPQAVETLDRAIALADSGTRPASGPVSGPALSSAPGTALSAALTERAITAKELGDYDRAADLYARVAQLQRGAGIDRADAATLEHNLSGLEYARGNYPQAEFRARRAVDRRRGTPGATEVEIAADLAVLAASVAAQRRYTEAREMFEQALFTCRAARPPRRYEIAVHLHGLADLEHSAGHAEEAERRYGQALAIKEQLLGPAHPEVGLVLGNLGALLQEQGRPGEAADCYRRAREIAERTFGREHPRFIVLNQKLSRTSRDPQTSP